MSITSFGSVFIGIVAGSGPRGREVKSAVDHLTAVSGVGSSPDLATCETSQVLLAGVSGVFSRGSPVFAHLLIDPLTFKLLQAEFLYTEYPRESIYCLYTIF